jgi:transcription factor IIIB subunit 2
MLIDFSDALQVNVYVLGTCFLKFRRLLGLKVEIIDPALFVYRFAAHLDLEEKANAVALTALRLVGRMKRDWIVAGRRPAGICAAALLIAARAHGFSRHHHDVTKILRVCGMTVTTRVKEFENTPSAMLTLDQFNTVELESEADPPVFTSNRIREVRVLRMLISFVCTWSVTSSHSMHHLFLCIMLGSCQGYPREQCRITNEWTPG